MIITEPIEKINLNGYPLNMQTQIVGGSTIKKIWGDDTLSGRDVLYLFKTEDGKYSAIINFFNSKKICKQASFKVPTKIFLPTASKHIADDIYIFNTWVRKFIPDYGEKAVLSIYATDAHIKKLIQVYKIMFLGNPGTSIERKIFGLTLSTYQGKYLNEIITANEETLFEFASQLVNFVPIDELNVVDRLEGGAQLKFDGSNYYLEDGKEQVKLDVGPEEKDESKRIHKLIHRVESLKTEPLKLLESIVVGSGSALTDQKMTNCYLLSPVKGSVLIVDPVHNPIETMLAVGKSSVNLDELVVTHIHGDHDTGGALDIIKFKHVYNRMNNTGKKLKFITTKSLFEIWAEKNALQLGLSIETFKDMLISRYDLDIIYLESKSEILKDNINLIDIWLEYSCKRRLLKREIWEDLILSNSLEVLYNFFLQERSTKVYFNFDIFEPPIKSKLELGYKQIEIRYNLHPTKTIGLKVTIKPEAAGTDRPIVIAYSGDTLYDPIKINEIFDDELVSLKEEFGVSGLSSEQIRKKLDQQTLLRLLSQIVAFEIQREDLKGFIWGGDCVYHETGIPPLHTDHELLIRLSDDIKKNIQWVHGDQSIKDWSTWNP